MAKADDLLFAVQRNGELKGCKGDELQDKLKDGDILAVTRNGDTYKLEVVQRPWDGHPGGIWHIQNVRYKALKLDLGWGAPGFGDESNPDRGKQVYAMDGTDLGILKEIPIGLECVIVTPPDCSGLFGKAPRRRDRVEFDFGPLTDTSKVICMRALLEELIGSPKGMEDWDTSNVVESFTPAGLSYTVNGMQSLVKNSPAFNEDLSGWCVTNFTVQPPEFSLHMDNALKPCWGHCPRGENGLGEDPCPVMPWIGHDGGIWHITNVTATVNLYKSSGFFTAWTPDGTELGEINAVNPGEEVVFITDKSVPNLFGNSNTNAEYEIGPLTNTTAVNVVMHLFGFNTKFKGVGVEYMDVSNVRTMEEMFFSATEFNGDVSGWDVSNVTNMAQMFKDAKDFNQDLSQWCVINVEQNFYFDFGADSWVLPKPVWGTCPP